MKNIEIHATRRSECPILSYFFHYWTCFDKYKGNDQRNWFKVTALNTTMPISSPFY